MRAQLLQRCFELLYGPLVFFHEPAGRLLMGAAWHERRRALIENLDSGALVLELGCGEGRMLSLAQAHGVVAIGVDPSLAMLKRAGKRTHFLVRADARQLPFPNHTFHYIVASYPGPWIFDTETQREIARVCRTNAQVRVLLGGSYQTGPCRSIRRWLASAAYGGHALDAQRAELARRLTSTELNGSVQLRCDRWGNALYWTASPVATGG